MALPVVQIIDNGPHVGATMDTLLSSDAVFASKVRFLCTRFCHSAWL